MWLVLLVVVLCLYSYECVVVSVIPKHLVVSFAIQNEHQNIIASFLRRLWAHSCKHVTQGWTKVNQVT